MTTPELLRKAATYLDDGGDPFGIDFLSTNSVSLDECFAMAEMLAVGARMVANGLEGPRSPLGQMVLLEMVKGV